MKQLILILILSVSIFAQDYVIASGYITDRHGRGMPSVAVYTGTLDYCDRHTTTWTRTNWYGYYYLAVRADCSFYITPNGRSINYRPNIFIYRPSIWYQDFNHINFYAIS